MCPRKISPPQSHWLMFSGISVICQLSLQILGKSAKSVCATAKFYRNGVGCGNFQGWCGDDDNSTTVGGREQGDDTDSITVGGRVR